MKSISRFISLVCIVLGYASVAGAQNYTLTKIYDPAYQGLDVAAMNNAGEVVGSLFQPNTGNPIALLWTPTGGGQSLGALPGDNISAATAINNNGDVVGYSFSGFNSTITRAFLWTKLGGIQDLGKLKGDAFVFALGINDAGQVVGRSCKDDNHCRAFLYTPNVGMQDLGNLGGDYAVALGINNSGQVTGISTTATGNTGTNLGFVWTAQEGLHSLGTLPGAVYSNAFAINSSGEVVGQSNDAFLWAQATGFQDLGAFQADNLNDKGEVVGNFPQTTRHRPHALLWTRTQGVMDLNTLTRVVGLYNASAINSAGQIAAKTKPSSYEYGYLLSPKMSVSLTSSSNPSVLGQAVTFTATVNSTVQGPPPDGETVKFKNGSATLGVGKISAGVASFATSSLQPGTHRITAIYSGDVNYKSQKSLVLTQTVTQ